jgi:hypothetical protein
MAGFKATLKKYFSGKLVAVQISAGVGAFAGRSIAAFTTSDLDTWIVVLSSQFGSFAGYIGIYFLGYWYVFKRDYRVSHRSMPKDVVQLQVVEQSPNLVTVISSAVAQAALMETANMGSDGLSSVFSANLASWFGPHKIANLAAMAGSNSLKKGWVDHTWLPGVYLRKLATRIAKPFRAAWFLRKSSDKSHHHSGKMAAAGQELLL